MIAISSTLLIISTALHHIQQMFRLDRQ